MSFALRNRESLCVLKAPGNALTLNTLRFASEVPCIPRVLAGDYPRAAITHSIHRLHKRVEPSSILL
jgi:non-homologous end joining protein Ku